MKPKIFYFRPMPGTSCSTLDILKEPCGLDALILDARDCFSVEGENSFLDMIEANHAQGVAVFIITGQRGTYEQHVAKRKELMAINAGAIPLGACKAEFLGLMQGFGEIFSQSTSLEEKIAEAQRRFYVPAIEANEFSSLIDFLIDGGSIELSKFMYSDYMPWLKIKNSEAYQPLSKASQRSAELIINDAVPEMISREIQDYYSMGPTPDLDKKLLEEFVRRKQKVRYHAIDISSKALRDTKLKIREYLSSIDKGWEQYVTIADEKPQLFEEVITSGKSCVSYPGGQLVNNPGLLSKAGEICRAGGLVIADLHLRAGDGDHEAFWISIYDIEEEKEMFRKGVLQFLPCLQNEDGWGIVVKYIKTKDEPDRISFQLEVDRDIDVWCNSYSLTLKPGVERELMMSRKYTIPEFRAEARKIGYSAIAERSVMLPKRSNIETDNAAGFGCSVLLAYKDQVQEQVNEAQRVRPCNIDGNTTLQPLLKERVG